MFYESLASRTIQVVYTITSDGRSANSGLMIPRSIAGADGPREAPIPLESFRRTRSLSVAKAVLLEGRPTSFEERCSRAASLIAVPTAVTMDLGTDKHCDFRLIIVMAITRITNS